MENRQIGNKKFTKKKIRKRRYHDGPDSKKSKNGIDKYEQRIVTFTCNHQYLLWFQVLYIGRYGWSRKRCHI